MTRTVTQQTTAQSLGSILKSAHDIMRKDKGLNDDLDRLPLLTWIMFLKFLDNLEIQREKETALTGLGRFVWGSFSWGCARRCTPGYHMTGLSALRNTACSGIGFTNNSALRNPRFDSTPGFHMARLAALEDARLSHGRDFTPRTCGQLDHPWAWDMDWTPLFRAESPQRDSLGWSESASGGPGDIPEQISPAL